MFNLKNIKLLVTYWWSHDSEIADKLKNIVIFYIIIYI